MTGSPSAAAVRRALVAAMAGAGVALVGVSVSNIAGLDGSLRAATERATAAPDRARALSFSTRPVRVCAPADRRSHPHPPPLT